MTDENDQNIDENICRTCLRTNTDELILMYQSDGKEISIFDDDISISQMITECCVHPVKVDDPLPKKICLKCVEDVKIAYNFRKQSELSYKTLIAFLPKNQNGQNFGDDNDDDDDNGEDSEDSILNQLPPLPKEPEIIIEMPPTEKCIQTDEISFYPCERCELKFMDYEQLKIHRFKQHKGEENKCRVCSKTYNRMSHLKRHIAASHPEIGLKSQIIECKICNKRYTRTECLKKHLQQLHGEKIKTKISKNQNSEGKNVADKNEKLEKFHCTKCKEDFKNDTTYKEHKCKGNDDDDVLNDEALNEPEVPIIETIENNSNLQEENDMIMDTSFHDNGNYSTSDEEDGKPLAQLRAEVKKQTSSQQSSNLQSQPKTKNLKNELSENSIDLQIKTENSDGINSKLKTSTSTTTATTTAATTSSTTTTTGAATTTATTTTNNNNNNKKLVRTTKKVHLCEKCNKTFTRSTHLRRHQLTHSDYKPFSCDVCHKGFTRIDHLNIHKLNHSDTKPYTCDICKRGFVRYEHLKRHKDSRHNTERLPNPKTEYCEICKRYFSSAKYLQVHIKSHTDRRFTCKHCDITFDTKPELTSHVKLHSNEKPFLCSECGLRFVRNDYLVIHMRRHKGEKPYKCKFCDKGFPRATDLTVHERYHTGEKTHLCTICGKGFQRAYNLLVHMRVHTGERPYQCPHCSKCFAQGNDLKAHIRRHTGERFKCDMCNNGFIQAYHLTQHKRNAHGIETQSHIRRVEKFVTPLEQQKQVEALQNKMKESTPNTSTTTNITNITETTVISNSKKNSNKSKKKNITNTNVTNKSSTSGGEELLEIPTQDVLQIVTTSNENNEIIFEQDSIKIEEEKIDGIETVQAQRINVANDDNQLLHTATQYLVVGGSSFTQIPTNASIFLTEIDSSKVKYENYE